MGLFVCDLTREADLGVSGSSKICSNDDISVAGEPGVPPRIELETLSIYTLMGRPSFYELRTLPYSFKNNEKFVLNNQFHTEHRLLKL